jgi:hypothetical protein
VEGPAGPRGLPEPDPPRPSPGEPPRRLTPALKPVPSQKGPGIARIRASPARALGPPAARFPDRETGGSPALGVRTPGGWKGHPAAPAIAAGRRQRPAPLPAADFRARRGAPRSPGHRRGSEAQSRRGRTRAIAQGLHFALGHALDGGACGSAGSQPSPTDSAACRSDGPQCAGQSGCGTAVRLRRPDAQGVSGEQCRASERRREPTRGPSNEWAPVPRPRGQRKPEDKHRDEVAERGGTIRGRSA